MSEEKTVQIKIAKDKLIVSTIALLGFIFIFLDWIKVKTGNSSVSAGFFDGKWFNIQFFYGMAKVFVIIAIIAFIVYVVSCFIDLKKIIPSLKNIDLNKWIPLSYFGVYALAIVCAFLGGLIAGESESYFGITMSINYLPAIGWYLGLITTASGLILTLKPDLLKKIKITK